MNRELFFIPLLAKEFAHPRRRSALAAALHEIEAAGRQAGYEIGHAQFTRFMAEARPTASGQVIVDTDGIHIWLDVPVPSNVEVLIPGLKPAHCQILLSTGLVLAELDLTAEDLIWDAAFGSEPFRMAADTEGQAPACARIYRLYGSSGDLRTYPGVESGSIGITLARRASD